MSKFNSERELLSIGASGEESMAMRVIKQQKKMNFLQRRGSVMANIIKRGRKHRDSSRDSEEEQIEV
jgi:hypothetical protein